MVLSLSHLKDLLPEVAARMVCLDHVEAHVDAEDTSRLNGVEMGGKKDELAYIIHTSGSTGRPKGVAVEHASICNFVRVASAHYGIEAADRVYRGMTIAFDFSVEEIWVSWMAGATLVPDHYFWQHERLWKLLTGAPFGGNPFKSMFMRMLGIKVGKRLFDAGCGIPEKTLVTIGDDCALNEGTVIQGHSLEDGTFKSGRIVLGNRCTVGVEAFVQYGVTMGDGSTLEADAFLMKGQDVLEGTSWVGNPAREVSPPRDQRPAPTGPRHRAVTGGNARRPLVLSGAAHSTRSPRRHKAVRI